jgi:hypothetical protein
MNILAAARVLELRTVLRDIYLQQITDASQSCIRYSMPRHAHIVVDTYDYWQKKIAFTRSP